MLLPLWPCPALLLSYPALAPCPCGTPAPVTAPVLPLPPSCQPLCLSSTVFLLSPCPSLSLPDGLTQVPVSLPFRPRQHQSLAAGAVGRVAGEGESEKERGGAAGGEVWVCSPSPCLGRRALAGAGCGCSSWRASCVPDTSDSSVSHLPTALHGRPRSPFYCKRCSGVPIVGVGRGHPRRRSSCSEPCSLSQWDLGTGTVVSPWAPEARGSPRMVMVRAPTGTNAGE